MKTIEQMRKELALEDNVVNAWTTLEVFASRGLRDGTITAYESLLVADTAAMLNRQAYLQPAYVPRVSIRTLVSLVMMWVTARAFGESRLMDKYGEWIKEAAALLEENRPHVVHEWLALLAMGAERELLNHIHNARQDAASDDSSPGPGDVYPYDLLRPECDALSQQQRECSEAIVDLIVEVEVAFGGA